MKRTARVLLDRRTVSPGACWRPPFKKVNDENRIILQGHVRRRDNKKHFWTLRTRENLKIPRLLFHHTSVHVSSILFFFLLGNFGRFRRYALGNTKPDERNTPTIRRRNVKRVSRSSVRFFRVTTRKTSKTTVITIHIYWNFVYPQRRGNYLIKTKIEHSTSTCMSRRLFRRERLRKRVSVL